MNDAVARGGAADGAGVVTANGFGVPRSERYFEDYVPGSVHEYGPVTLSEQEIIEFASKYDPQYFHTDPEAAKDGPFGGLIASGWHTSSLIAGMFVREYLSSVASLGGPGVDELRFRVPVRPGDALRMRVTVVEARPSRSKPDRGLVRTLVEVLNQRDETAASMVVLNLLRRRNPGSTDRDLRDGPSASE